MTLIAHDRHYWIVDGPSREALIDSLASRQCLHCGQRQTVTLAFAGDERIEITAKIRSLTRRDKSDDEFDFNGYFQVNGGSGWERFQADINTKTRKGLFITRSSSELYRNW